MQPNPSPVHQQKMESIGYCVPGLTHELKNLWMVVASSLDLLRLEFPDNEKILETLQLAEDSGNRFNRVVLSLREFATRPANEVVLLDPFELLNEVRPMLSAVTRSRIRLEIQSAKALPMIRANTSQLEQMLLNLGIDACERLNTKAGTLSFTLAKNLDLPQPVVTFEVKIDTENPTDWMADTPLRRTAMANVQEIAEQHDAHLEFTDLGPQGFSTKVHWPIPTDGF